MIHWKVFCIYHFYQNEILPKTDKIIYSITVKIQPLATAWITFFLKRFSPWKKHHQQRNSYSPYHHLVFITHLWWAFIETFTKNTNKRFCFAEWPFRLKTVLFISCFLVWFVFILFSTEMQQSCVFNLVTFGSSSVLDWDLCVACFALTGWWWMWTW